MEILAPAGSKKSFIAAVEAGADAVYCGLGRFSARSKAENFSPQEFCDYTHYAHSKNVKVYAAFNTLVKQQELKEAVKQLAFVDAAGADAVIVQDFGVAGIVKKYFPALKLHASTQMAVHNAYGVSEAAKAGFKRVVLARELSFAEINKIAEKSNIEIETFVHGALCFCVSGVCLMSSVIGGYSGNRGLCAQPCRRKWAFKDKNGFYLSPKDLELARYIPELKKAGIASLKIEGRMKNPQYVYKTVKAYKMLTDYDGGNYAETLKEAGKLLSEDFARPKTVFNFSGQSPDIFTPETPKQIGINLGKVLTAQNGIITLESDFGINKGDVLKAGDSSGDSFFKFNILNIRKSGKFYEIETDCAFLKAGTYIFKTSDGNFDVFIDETIKNVKIEKRGFTVKPAGIKIPFFKPLPAVKEELFFRIEDILWLRHISPDKANIIFALNKENLKQALTVNAAYFELPAYIEENDIPAFQETVSVLIKKKKPAFFINNISHFSFFSDLGAKLFAGQFLYVLNSFTADFLFKRGLKGFAFSWEDDLKNISEFLKHGLAQYGLFYLSGFPALAFSKMKTHKDFPDEINISSSKDSFKILRKNSGSYILPQFPVMLFDKKRQLKKLNINKFAIDLSFTRPDKNYLEALIAAYTGKTLLQNGYEFNYERGLR